MDSVIEAQPGGAAVIRLSGRFDFLSATKVRERFVAAVEGGHRRLVVDLAAVDFMDSSGLGALIGGLKSARQAGGDLRLAAAGTQAQSVLKLTSLDRVFRAYASVEDALADY
jgi:anti-sigma B factor antagonist